MSIPADSGRRVEIFGLTAVGLTALPFPETMPAYASLLVDEEDNLWVEEYRYPEEEMAHWSIFHPRDHLSAIIETPRAFRPHIVDNGLVIGVSRDEFDVEYVEIYELIRP